MTDEGLWYGDEMREVEIIMGKEMGKGIFKEKTISEIRNPKEKKFVGMSSVSFFCM